MRSRVPVVLSVQAGDPESPVEMVCLHGVRQPLRVEGELIEHHHVWILVVSERGVCRNPLLCAPRICGGAGRLNPKPLGHFVPTYFWGTPTASPSAAGGAPNMRGNAN